MALADEIANDYLIFDDLETVTVRSNTRTSFTDTLVYQAALRTQARTSEASPGDGKNVETTILWTVPRVLLTVRPKPADEVIDGDGVTWTVLRVDEASQRTRYRLDCIDLVLTYDLRNRLTIMRATATTDEFLGRTITRVPVVVNAPCSIVLTSEAPATQRDKRGIVRTFDVVLQSRTPLEIEDHLIDDTGRVLTVKSMGNASRLDSLWFLVCEEQR